jgi:hypothetical protein
MDIKNSEFARMIASKFIDSSLSGKLFLERTKIIINRGIKVLTILFCIFFLRKTFTSGVVPSIATLAISLLLYSATTIILIKLTPIYAKAIQRKKIELCIKKCIFEHQNRAIISSSKFIIFTSISTDNQLKYANRISQIDNVIIELHKPSFSKGGTLLIINIVDPKNAEQQLYLKQTISYIKKKEIAFDYQL